MTRADRILAFGIAILALVAVPLVALAVGTGGGDAVVVGPAGRSVLSLDTDQTVVVEGLQGSVVVEVRSGAVSVKESSCPDKVCVHSSPIDAQGGVIACVPNGVTVTVGSAGGGLDAIVR